MLLALKIASIVVALIVLLRFKVDLALTIFLLSLYTVILFQVNLTTAWFAAAQEMVSSNTIQLFIITTMVLYIETVQKSRHMFDKLISSLNSMMRDTRIVGIVSPAIIGFLPLLGGALISAPLVDVSTKNLNLKPEFKTFINYWFRHIWEYVWPIYASLVLFQTLSGIPLKTIILYQAPFTVLNVITGLVVTLLYFKKHHIKREIPGEIHSFYWTIRNFFEGIWPLLLIIILFFFVSVPLHITLPVVAGILTVTARMKISEIFQMFFSKSSLRIVILVAAVMVFQQMIEISNAFSTLSQFGMSLGVVVAVIFLVSFSMGFLTGVNTAFIAIAYPILLPLIKNLPEAHFLPLSLYVFVIGFTGIMVSPLHLCLVLTNEYFKSNLYKVYHYILWPGLICAAAATILALIL
ncbi:MAG: DUF401 family protein [Acidobacteria bacterium]|jgi:hypothetical protein|nr:DUF401 family protein [Acidobacteriota bacterium]